VLKIEVKNKRPRCFHQGLLPTGNPQSVNSLGQSISVFDHFYKFMPRWYF